MPNVRLALDKSLRHYDADGRLHVKRTNISKAMVSPYLGSEIPEAETLGLDPTKIYMLLRDPEELAKGAATFNNLQLLKIHKPVDVMDPAKQLTVGSIGSDVAFNAPYLQSSLCIWDAGAIAGVESEEQAELSSAYRYRADMTPGTYEGTSYDGVMRDIVGNHVALVPLGRAGDDVVVADSNPFIQKENAMPTAQGKTRLSSKAIAVAGALRAYLTPKLAQDQAVGSLRTLVQDVKSATYDKQKPLIAQRLRAAVKGKLAQDADLEDLDRVLNALSGKEDANMVGDDLDLAAMDGEEDDEEDDPDNPGMKRKKVTQAADEPPETPGTPKPPTKAAMDAAIAAATATAVATATKNVEALHVAREEVASIVGKVALDSADAVYKFALDHLKIDTTDVHPSAYRSLVKLASAAKPAAAAGGLIAQDAATVKAVVTQFPHVGRFKHA